MSGDQGEGIYSTPLARSSSEAEASDTRTSSKKINEDIKVEIEEGEEAEDEELAKLPPRHQTLQEGADSFVEVSLHNRAALPDELKSAAKWEDLDLPELVMKGIYMKGFAAPSKIQGAALPLILRSDAHMIAQAKNGSGKTATFALAMITKTNPASSQVQCIALAPSRELAKQNLDVIEDLANFTTIRCCLGCPPYSSPKPECQIVSGTPGKIRDWLQRKKIDARALKMFVLDEADVMIDERDSMGTQVVDVAKMIKKTNKKVQVLLFSATYPERVRVFALNMAPEANRITMRKEELTLSTTQQYWCELPNQDSSKLDVLFDLYQSMVVGQSVIFCNTRQAADTVARAMQDKGFAVTLICGTGRGPNAPVEMTTQAREQRMAEFRSGSTRVLVTTDLLARGIDVPAVTLVINYELPVSHKERGIAEYETYLHRVGRTGRFGQKGVAISFATSESDKRLIQDIEGYYRCSIAKLPLDYEQIYQMMKGLRL